VALGGFVEVRGPQGTRLVELTSDRSSLGRATTNDVVVLLDATVSRLHAVIERTRPASASADLGSANGTFVNGEPVRGETGCGRATSSASATAGSLLRRRRRRE